MSRSPYSSLQANAVYDGPHGAEYRTDSAGRVVHWKAEAHQTPKDAQLRNQKAQYTLEGKGPGFEHAGHLLANQHGGAGEKYNLVPMNAHVNTVDYKAFETETTHLLSDGSRVFLNGSVSYSISPELNGVNQPEAFMAERTTVSPDGKQTDREYVSWSNLDMREFETAGNAESESLMNQFANPGAVAYDEEKDLILDENTGGVLSEAEAPAAVPGAAMAGTAALSSGETPTAASPACTENEQMALAL